MVSFDDIHRGFWQRSIQDLPLGHGDRAILRRFTQAVHEVTRAGREDPGRRVWWDEMVHQLDRSIAAASGTPRGVLAAFCEWAEALREVRRFRLLGMNE